MILTLFFSAYTLVAMLVLYGLHTQNARGLLDIHPLAAAYLALFWPLTLWMVLIDYLDERMFG